MYTIWKGSSCYKQHSQILNISNLDLEGDISDIQGVIKKFSALCALVRFIELKLLSVSHFI